MDVLIRSISPMVVRRIDELAKQEKQSRNEYLKEQFENMSYLDEYKRTNEMYQGLYREVRILLEKSYKKMDGMEKGYDKLFELISLVTEIDLDHVDQFIEERKTNNFEEK